MNHSTTGVGVGAIFFVNIVIIIAVICGVVWGCNKVREKGLKGCIETVWDGPDTNSVPVPIVPDLEPEPIANANPIE